MNHDMRQFTRQPDGTITVSHIPTPLEAPADTPPDFDDGSPYCTCAAIPSTEELDWNVCAGCGKVIK